MRRTVARLILISAFAIAPVAGQHLVEFVPDNFPVDTETRIQRHSVADADGDGLPDFLLDSRLLLNDGGARFRDPPNAWFAANTILHWVRYLDVDLDGDLDLFAMTGPDIAVPRIFYNRGDRYELAPVANYTFIGGGWSNAHVFDADGQGSLDVVAFGPAIVLLLGAGDGTLYEPSPTGPRLYPANVKSAISWDFDHDGDLDLITSNRRSLFGPRAHLWENDGAGGFTEVPGRLPALPYTLSNMVRVDVDGDGFDEIAGVVDPFESSPYPNALRILSGNASGGSITDTSDTFVPTGLPAASFLSSADIDGDGGSDLVLMGDDFAPVVLTPSAGVLQVFAAEFPRESRSIEGMQQIDIDADGDGDLVLSFPWYRQEWNRPAVWLNVGPGRFIPLERRALPLPPERDDRALAGDFDGDGDLDLLTFTIPPIPSPAEWQLLRNDGYGRFEEIEDVVPDGAFLLDGTQTGDPDADGDLDILVGTADAPLLINDGTGRFSAPTDLTGGFILPSGRWSFVDAERDGDLDLFGNTPQGPYLLINDGSGRFAEDLATRFVGGVAGNDHAVAIDIDGDGDEDLVCVESSAVYVNDGTGRFRNEGAYRLPSDRLTSIQGLLVADFDGNGAIDLIPDNRLWLNNGFGYFTDVSPFYVGAGRFLNATAIGDVDGDGDVDVIEASVDRPIQFNDGSGRFTRVDRAVESPRTTEAPRLVGDFDEDGDLDGVAHPYRSLFAGTGAHLRLETPAVRGQVARLRVMAEPGRATVSRSAWILAGLFRDREFHPGFGWLKLDVSTALILQPVVLPPPAGEATMSLPIPAIPALQGHELVFQALVAGAGMSRLTNAEPCTIR